MKTFVFSMLLLLNFLPLPVYATRWVDYSDFSNQTPKRNTNRKVWSEELHDLFLQAIKDLGGIKFATAAKILEKMGVNGLTRTQVGSHLQKYKAKLEDKDKMDIKYIMN